MPNSKETTPYLDFSDLEEKEYRQIKQEILNVTLSLSKGDSSSRLESAFDKLRVKSREIDWIWVGPHSRRKITLQVGPQNEVGFFLPKSKKIIEISDCSIAENQISDFILPLKKFLKSQDQNFFTQISITLFDNGLDLIFSSAKDLNFSQSQKLIAFAKEQNFNISHRIKNHVTPIFKIRNNQIFYPDFKIDVGSEIFIQATKSGLAAIIKIIRDFLIQNKQIKNIADIYAGFGAYSFAIVDLAKSISAIEGDQKMVNSINKNAAANNFASKLKAETEDLFSCPVVKRTLDKLDLAIINPPRNGASPQVLEIAKSTLKNLIYVSCNPESFTRDAKILIDSGFTITKLTALDQFYSTKHLELIAIFQKK